MENVLEDERVPQYWLLLHLGSLSCNLSQYFCEVLHVHFSISCVTVTAIKVTQPLSSQVAIVEFLIIVIVTMLITKTQAKEIIFLN